MSRVFRHLVSIFLTALLTVLPPSTGRAAASSRPAGHPPPLVVESIRTGEHGETTRIVIDLSRATEFRVFQLAAPARVVIDLQPVGWRTPKTGFMTHPVLQGYRSGFLEDGLTRVIFDLRKSAVVSDAFFIPKSEMEKDRIVIDLQPSTPNMFAAKLSTVFGARNLKGPGAPPPASSGYAEMENKLVRSAARSPPPDPASAPPKSYMLTTPQQDRMETAPRLAAARLPYGVKPPKKYTIVIDAGHGGGDPGASGPYGIREKNITLAVARELERQFQETGRYSVVMTRDRDVYIKLRQRVEISRRVHGDLFISIHADKIARNNVRGASIYTLSENASDAETARLADDENNSGVVAGVDLAAESDDVAGILLDLAMRQKMNDSKVLSKSLESAFLNNNVRLLLNSHRAAGFAVLKAPDVPSVLIETGFLSNPEEAKLLTTPQFQRRIAGAILNGVDAYFRKIQLLQKL